MIRPGDRARVRAYLDDMAGRGYGVTAASTISNALGLQHLSPAEARSILDELVAAGLATVAVTRESRYRLVSREMRVYRAVAAANQSPVPPRSPARKGAGMK